MKRRILALVCMVLILAGTLALGVTADTQTGRYEVGYAIKDINPWADPTNKVYDAENSDGILLAVPMSGYANSDERPSGKLADDNGDGVIDNNDGIQVTCTSVTDSWGTTVMYFTVDAISGYGGTHADLKAAMVEALGSDVIKGSQIMLCGSHTHEGADLDTCRAAEEGTDQRTYYEYALSQLVAAGLEAYNGRTEAVMTKGEIDASKSSGYQLNYVRHYNVEEQKKVNGEWTVINSFVGGSNFGGSKTETSTSTLIRTVENVSEANDTMYLLQFAPTNGDAPIVLVNWRAHATLFGGGSTDATISSDYINSLRYQLEKAGYRAAFIQSASGNVNARRVSTAMTPWCGATVSESILPNPTVANLYGYLLSQVALDCLENNMTCELEPGRIRTMYTSLKAQAQVDSEGLLAAADAWYEAVQAGETITYPYDEYTHTDGKTYIINSKYHANNIRSRRSNVEGTLRSFSLNAISLGPSVAMVTSPCEMFDRYSLNLTLDNTTENDWLNLVNDETYGTPWLLGYTNGHLGYIPNSLAFSYNEGHSLYGVGAYEANTSRVAQGEGEKFIVTYGRMLKVVAGGYKTDYCQHCDAQVEWTPWTLEQVSAGKLETGHYYLVEDVPVEYSAQQGFVEGAVVCLDLNGHNISTKGRSINMGSSTQSTLNLMGEGTITSCEGGNNPGGGLITVSSGCTLNMYGGTLTAVNTGDETVTEIGKAGVVALHGVMNMYGGTIKGANLEMSSYFTEGDTENGCGAAIYIYAGGKLNLAGGHIQAGTVPEGGRGACVYAYHTNSCVDLTGDAQVDEIYFNKSSASSLTVTNAFSGSANLNFNTNNVTIAGSLDIGDASNADLTGSKLTCVNDSTYNVGVYSTNLKLNQRTSSTVATSYGAQGVKHFTAVSTAAAVSGTTCVELHKDETKAVTIKRDICLELNGHSITGTVTVVDGATLYGMDSQTDDLTVADGNYGKLTSVTGSVSGAWQNMYGDEVAYIKVTEGDGISFHRASMEISAMSLRASRAGVYYKSTFKTDEVASQHVAQFGVALSVRGVPALENLKRDCQCSVFTEFVQDQETYSGTLLRWVMHTGNPTNTNKANAEMPIYGRSYILTDEGQYVFGNAVSRSFREQVEGVDALWDTLTDVQKEEVRSLYMKNIFVMKNWNIPNIKEAFGADSGDVSFDDLLK